MFILIGDVYQFIIHCVIPYDLYILDGNDENKSAGECDDKTNTVSDNSKLTDNESSNTDKERSLESFYDNLDTKVSTLES